MNAFQRVEMQQKSGGAILVTFDILYFMVVKKKSTPGF